MAEAVPVGAGLEAQRDVVVAGVEGVGATVRIHALVDGVQGHRRVVPARNEPDLDAIVFQPDGQRDCSSVANAVTGGQDHLGRDEVQGAELVVGPPSTPVADL